MACAPGLSVSIRFALPVPPALVAEMVTPKMPPTVGVPEMTPLIALTANPDGRFIAANDIGVLLAPIW